MARAHIEYPVGRNGQWGVTLLDLDVAEWLGGRVVSLSAQGYARLRVDGRQRTLHRIILDLPVGGLVWGDHINRNKLDNRRCNLRPVTPAENAQNRPVVHRNSSPRGPFTRGTTFADGQWRAQVQYEGRFRMLGYAATQYEAWAIAEKWRRENMRGYVPEGPSDL